LIVAEGVAEEEGIPVALVELAVVAMEEPVAVTDKLVTLEPTAVAVGEKPGFAQDGTGQELGKPP